MSARWTPEDYANYQARKVISPAPVPKYRNKRTEVDGILFDSRREATRWVDLKVMQDLGIISGLTRQESYPLIVNGIKVCTYRCDFQYFEQGKKIVEDSKGVKTQAYRIKKKLMLAVYGIAIRET